MLRRPLTLLLILLLVLLQWPLWFGRGGYLRISEQERQLALAKQQLQEAQERNQKMRAENNDLRNGRESLEERARYELNMVKPNEVFIQVYQAPPSKP